MKTYRVVTKGYDLILGNPIQSVKYVLDNLEKAIERAKKEKASMIVPNVLKWESTEIMEFDFVKIIDVHI